MIDAVGVFIAGISGVFLGMALLYVSIKIVSGVTSRFNAKEGEK